MEKSLAFIQQHYPLSEVELRSYSAQAFAYIGDSVYDMIIRTMVMSKGNNRPNKYHQEVIPYVNAAAQTEMVHKIKNYLTEEEMTIFKRGRNAKTMSPAKNQSIHDYRFATGFEALLGYLYLSGKMDRAMQLVRFGLGQGELQMPAMAEAAKEDAVQPEE